MSTVCSSAWIADADSYSSTGFIHDSIATVCTNLPVLRTREVMFDYVTFVRTVLSKVNLELGGGVILVLR